MAVRRSTGQPPEILDRPQRRERNSRVADAEEKASVQKRLYIDRL